MKDFTDITVVLDVSGSMADCIDDTIGGFNTFVEDQKKHGSNASLTLVQFDNHYEVVYEARPIGEVPPLTRETFVPRGGTALLDAIGRTINSVGARLAATPESERPDKVFLFILSDGGENSSREFADKNKVGEMIKHQQDKYNWVFLYAGADFDAYEAGRSFGYSGHTTNYSKAGSAQFFASTSEKVKTYRSTGNFA